MDQVTQVPQAPQITYDELCRQKGEAVTQMEILQGRLQMINQQLQTVMNKPRGTTTTA